MRMARQVQPPRPWVYVAAAVAALYLAFAAGVWWAKSSVMETKHRKAFVLAVSLTFERLEDRDQFIELWRVHMAPHVKEHEPNCLSYELAIADTDPKKILVYERYASRSDLLEVHQRSEAYITFKKLRKELSFNYVVHGQSYLETNMGFMSRL